MKAIVFLTCIFLCAVSLLRADPDFMHPKSYLGSADKDGCVYFWSDLTEIHLKDGTKLPLRLRFATGPKLSAPLFGRFWWCPLLESTLVSTQETLIEFTTLGGRRIALRKKKDGGYASGDGRYNARMASPSETILIGDGWEYRFVSGKLKSAKHEGGSELEWVYLGTKLMSLNDKASGALISLEYSANGALPTAMVVGKTRYGIASQQIPIATDVMGQAVVAGYAASLAEMKTSAMLLQFPIKLERDGKYQMDSRVNGDEGLKYVWRAQSGVLESDGKWTYQASKTDDGVPLVSRTDKTGGVESYFYDGRKGISENKLPSGELISRQYFIASGPTQNLLRKLVISKDGQESEVRQWSYDEMGRRIRERTGDYERSWDWHPNGTLAAYAVKSGDKVLEKKLYNTEGNIIERIRGSFSYRYSYDEGKSVAQQYLDGKLISTKVSDLQKNQQFFFSEAPGEEVGKGKILTFTPASPNDIENARRLAVQALSSVP